MITPLSRRDAAIATLMALPWDPAPLDPDHSLRIRAFLHALSDAGLDIATNAISACCKAGHGFILRPDMGPPRATHLYEITLFDLPATGMTMPEAAHNWLTIARRATQAPEAA